MNFLFEACENSGVLEIVQIIMKIIRIITIIAPIILIVMVTLDFSKNVISGTEEDMRKNFSTAIKRIIVCAVIFLIPPIVEFTMGLLDGIGTVGDYTKCITNANNEYIEERKEEEKLLYNKSTSKKQTTESKTDENNTESKTSQNNTDSKNKKSAAEEKQERIEKAVEHSNFGYVTDIEEKSSDKDGAYKKYTFSSGNSVNTFTEGDSSNTKNKVQTIHYKDGSYTILYKNGNGTYNYKRYDSSKKLKGTKENINKEDIESEFYLSEIW